MSGLAWLVEMLMRVRNVYSVQCSRLNRLVVTRLIFEDVDELVLCFAELTRSLNIETTPHMNITSSNSHVFDLSVIRPQLSDVDQSGCVAAGLYFS